MEFVSGAIGVVIGVSVVMIWNEHSRVKLAREVSVEIASEVSVELASEMSIELASEMSVQRASSQRAN